MTYRHRYGGSVSPELADVPLSDRLTGLPTEGDASPVTESPSPLRPKENRSVTA